MEEPQHPPAAPSAAPSAPQDDAVEPPAAAAGEFAATGDSEAWTRKQSIEAGQFAVFVGGKRIPGRQLALGAAAVLLLFVTIVVAVASSGGGGGGGGGGGDDPTAGDVAAAGASDETAEQLPTTSYAAVCGKTEAEMGVDLVADYPFYRGVLPPGVELRGSAYLDDN